MRSCKPLCVVLLALPMSLAQARQPADAQALLPQSEASRAEQRACLEQKIRERQQAQQAKRGMGSLLSAAGRLAGRFGVPEVSQAIGDARLANATVEDLSSAARDLGLTENEIAACRNPG